MKRISIFLLLALMALPMLAQNQQPVSTSMDPSRYDMVQSPILRSNSFLLDKFTGRVWQVYNDRETGTAFKEVFVEDRPSTEGNEAIYKIYMSGMAAADCFLLNTKTGALWQFVKSTATGDLFFEKVFRKDGTVDPVAKQWLQEAYEMGLENPYVCDAASQLKHNVLQADFRIIWMQFSNWKSLDCTLYKEYRNVFNWVRTNPTKETIDGLEEIDMYMMDIEYSMISSKLAKQLRAASTIEEKYSLLLEAARAAKK